MNTTVPDTTERTRRPMERGATTIADRAVRRIAAHAASEALGRGAGAVSQATADVRGRSARIDLDVRVPYPSDIGAACDRTQQRVAERVGMMTELTVAEVSVRVGGLDARGRLGKSRSRVDEDRSDSSHSLPGPGHSVDVGELGLKDAPRHRARRPRRLWAPRRVPAGLLALAGAVVCGLLLYETVAGLTGLPPTGWPGQAADAVAGLRSRDARWLVGGVVLVLLGLGLLLLALTPGARRGLVMVPPPGSVAARAVIDRPAVALLLRDTAMGVTGVSGARIAVRRHSVRARITVRFGDVEEVRAQVAAALAERSGRLGLARTLKVRVRGRPDPRGDAFRAPNASEFGDGGPDVGDQPGA